MSPDEITRHVQPGDAAVVAQVLGEPTILIDELLWHVADLNGLRLSSR